MFFTSSAGKRKKRKQRSEYFALDHTASECDCGHHTSTTSLQCLGVMNETVVFNGKVSIPFCLSLKLFFFFFFKWFFGGKHSLGRRGEQRCIISIRSVNIG